MWTRCSALVLAAAVAGCSSNDGNQGTPDSGSPTSNSFTLHYHRALADYSGWNVAVSAGANESSVSSSSTDAFGAVYQLTVRSGAAQLAFTLVNGSSTDPAGNLTVDVSGTIREAWVFSGYGTAITHKPVAIPGDNQVAVYYRRPDSNYSGWGLHTWGDVVQETQWTVPLQPVGVDPDLGQGFLINVKPSAARVNIIVHKGDTKDPGPDMGWDLATLGDIVFVSSGSANITAFPKRPGDASIDGAAAHLVEPLLVAWDVTDAAATSFELRYSSTASIAASGTDVTGGETITLTPSPSGLPPAVLTKAPYLNTGGTPWRAFTIAAGDAAKVEDALKGQVVAVARKADGTVLKATQVQTAWAIDALYVYSGPLGVAFDPSNVPTIRVWAPTAQAVKLHVADPSKHEIAAVDLTEDASGVWSATGDTSWYAKYYRFEVTVFHPATGHIETTTVTDPYAVNLDTNGLWGQLIDLDDPRPSPRVGRAREAQSRRARGHRGHEGHIRDFSALDSTVPAAHRGNCLHRDRLRQHAAPGDAGRIRPDALPPPGVRLRHGERGPGTAGRRRPALLRPVQQELRGPAALCTQFGRQSVLDAMKSFPETRPAAGHRHLPVRARQLQLGIRPIPLRRAGGATQPRPRVRPRSSSSGRW
jgi:pullulanase